MFKFPITFSAEEEEGSCEDNVVILAVCAHFLPLCLSISVAVVHFPIIQSSVSGFLHNYLLMSVAQIRKSFFSPDVVLVLYFPRTFSLRRWRYLYQGHACLV